MARVKRSTTQRICKQCGSAFHPWANNLNQPYCSRACSHKGKERQVQIVCERCGVEFSVYQARSKARFCSWECRASGVIKVCAVCESPFRLKPSDAKYRKTCSRECGYKFRAVNSPVAPWTGKKRSAKTRQRVSDGLKRHYSGNPTKHWNYQGGEWSYKRGPSWQEQRSKARARDNYTCQGCGKAESSMSRQLCVHHIVPYRRFSSSEEANDLNNLISVCQSCHMRMEHGKLKIGHSITPSTRR